MKEAIRMGAQRAILETDAAMVRSALEGDDFRLSSIGGIITEIKSLLLDVPVSCKISVCSRGCNKVAHAVAALGCKNPSGVITTWDEVPQGLEGWCPAIWLRPISNGKHFKFQFFFYEYIVLLADEVNFLIFELGICDKSSNTTFYNFTNLKLFDSNAELLDKKLTFT
jgi:hypothetical protein